MYTNKKLLDLCIQVLSDHSAPCLFVHAVSSVPEAKLSGFIASPGEEDSGPYLAVNLRPQISKEAIIPYQGAPGGDVEEDRSHFTYTGVELRGVDVDGLLVIIAMQSKISLT